MVMHRSSLLVLVAAMAIPACNCSQAAAQTSSEASHPAGTKASGNGAPAHAVGKPSMSLTVTGPEKTLTFSVADLKAMPHTTVQVFNEHAKVSERYAGVPLAALLTLAEVPVGKSLHGKAFLLYLLAEGTDGYRVLYSLSEVDPENHTGDVIVADSLNGNALTADGALKLISSEEKRPARWVRNLTKITIRPADVGQAQ